MSELIQKAEYHYYNTDENSDKVYRVEIIKDGNNYVVWGHWGKRGNNLQSQQKYNGPSRLEASTAYNKTKQDRVRKGYNDVTGQKVIPPSTVSKKYSDVQPTKPQAPKTPKDRVVKPSSHEEALTIIYEEKVKQVVLIDQTAGKYVVMVTKVKKEYTVTLTHPHNGKEVTKNLYQGTSVFAATIALQEEVDLLVDKGYEVRQITY